MLCTRTVSARCPQSALGLRRPRRLPGATDKTCLGRESSRALRHRHVSRSTAATWSGNCSFHAKPDQASASTTHGSCVSHMLMLAQMARKIVLQPALTRRSRGDLHLSGSLHGARSTTSSKPARPRSSAASKSREPLYANLATARTAGGPDSVYRVPLLGSYATDVPLLHVASIGLNAPEPYNIPGPI